ncbi:hypothetical protein Anacy_1069 [Anabaena cylindrica PCC 7122]|uniref:Uncharacterized protein n=1 Tax=Anabaena cylindrica (strain ATCC 27899 / PCC 7122) TaxID=272123 RepID=K9ZBT1_ANACC|nr:hypothetical protein Anacy_1069 [Anabaena cylindrica PCC 7122]BAY00907.1 hypothetical protein NIES19_01370 [Anabaena cylindrica PCC 7122]
MAMNRVLILGFCIMKSQVTSRFEYIAFPTLVRYKITPPQPSPYQGEGARQRGWGVFHELGNCYIFSVQNIDIKCLVV